ncbi:TPA: sulfurtransferase TusA family protein [Candidatus Woesearchaeota archaeon]|nr:sulfurtransferase TusA family protein [Candidatus Woesearchaeota archaeon]HII69347.1 sulfurtransferase TusA family protein [Candidatus Woesearchaeota archaeon]
MAEKKHLDIKGEVCPYTFVKTKLALEGLSSGDVLEVVTDHKQAVTNVTRSCEAEGHDILSKEQLNENDWKLTIRKK